MPTGPCRARASQRRQTLVRSRGQLLGKKPPRGYLAAIEITGNRVVVKSMHLVHHRDPDVVEQ